MTGTIVASGTNTFNFTGTIVTDVVATAGTYHIAVFGAQGGTGYSTHPGGLGADIEGDVVLTQGETIEIVVGGAGTSGASSSGGGGGGGSFVLAINNGTIVPLVIAGGGGGGERTKILPSAPRGRRRRLRPKGKRLGCRGEASGGPMGAEGRV